MRIGFQKFFVVRMRHHQEEKTMLAKMLFDPADHHRTVRISDLRDDPDRVSTLYPQRAGKKIGPVIQLSSRIQDTIFGVLR